MAIETVILYQTPPSSGLYSNYIVLRSTLKQRCNFTFRLDLKWAREVKLYSV